MLHLYKPSERKSQRAEYLLRVAILSSYSFALMTRSDQPQQITLPEVLGATPAFDAGLPHNKRQGFLAREP